MKCYVGLDLSLCNTGLVVLDENGQIYYHLVISVKSRDIERLENIRAMLMNTLKNLSSTCDIVINKIVVEGYSFGSRLGQAFSIGELGGVIKLDLWKNYPDIVTIVPPTRLKKFVTGKGNAKKDVMMKYVYKKWAYNTDNDNLADAFGLAKIAYHLCNSKGLKKIEKEVIDAILNPAEKTKGKK